MAPHTIAERHIMSKLFNRIEVSLFAYRSSQEKKRVMSFYHEHVMKGKERERTLASGAR